MELYNGYIKCTLSLDKSDTSDCCNFMDGRTFVFTQIICLSCINKLQTSKCRKNHCEMGILIAEANNESCNDYNLGVWCFTTFDTKYN